MTIKTVKDKKSLFLMKCMQKTNKEWVNLSAWLKKLFKDE